VGTNLQSERIPLSEGTRGDPPWQSLGIEETLDRLKSHHYGLTAAEARLRLLANGPNTLELKEQRTLPRILIGQFTDFMILVLIAGAIISGIIGDLKDTIVIAAIILLNGAIGFIQEYRAERALAALQRMSAPTARVIRDGKATTIPAAEVVSGDIVLLESGNVVPADMRLIESADLKTEEAALTGESLPVEKVTAPLEDPDLPVGDRRNIAYMGTLVIHAGGEASSRQRERTPSLGRSPRCSTLRKRFRRLCRDALSISGSVWRWLH
jgi:Ca2+-transporting ATPase